MLGREETRPILIFVLDAVLNPAPGHRTSAVELLNPFPLTHDLEFHILELPKFTKKAEELATDLDICLYFLLHAAKMDTEALPPALQKTPMALAVEELKMLAQNEQERERYEARRKAQLDYNTDMKVSRMRGREEGRTEGRTEGRMEGRTEGEKIGMIHAFERMLNRPETSTDQLASLSLEDLTRLADSLQEQLRNQQ